MIFDLKKELVPSSAIQKVVELVEAGKISRTDALTAISTSQVEALLYHQFQYQVNEVQDSIIAKGINASPGAATGKIFFNLDRAKKFYYEYKKPIIWVCIDLKPDKIDDISFAVGWIVHHSGATSHVAVVARQKGIPCITGIKDVKIHATEQKVILNGYEVSEGDWVSIDGSTGVVIKGKLEILPAKIDEEIYLHKLLKWADEVRVLKVYANADTPEDAMLAKKFCAEGIGVCRTEHMFLDDVTLPLIQQLVISYEVSEHLVLPSNEIESVLINHLLPIQRKVFYDLFKVMNGAPVIIRLLDMPIDEFVSNDKAFIQNAQSNNFFKKNLNEEQIIEILDCIHEVNPMLGFRGSRLGILRPAIYEMQVRAIIEAACQLIKESGNDQKTVSPKIMLPLISFSKEVETLKKLVDDVAHSVMKEQNCKVVYLFGTMIETPESAFIADKIVDHAQFLSFGTNDLTQTTMGISRDDAERKFLLDYIERGYCQQNPFQVLDRNGLVGFLIKLATEKAKKKSQEIGNDMEIGICGEHGGNEESIFFCHDIGLDYISCSPNRILVARLAAAHAALEHG